MVPAVWPGEKYSIGLPFIHGGLVVTAVMMKLVLTAVTTKLVVTAVTMKLVVSAYF